MRVLCFCNRLVGNCFVNYFALMRTNDANWNFCGSGTSGLLRAGNQSLFNEYCIHISPTCQFVNVIRRYLASNRRAALSMYAALFKLVYRFKIHFYTGLRNHNIWLSVPLYCIISELLIRHQLYYTDGFS